MATILILDDDPQMLASLSDVLQSSGYSVACASSSQQALEVVQADTERFDLVVADIRMSGMDGLECLRKMHDLSPGMKSVVITGFASEDAPGRAMDADCSDYLRKPFTADDLLQSVSRALDSRTEATAYEKLLNRARAVAQKVEVALTGLEGLRNQVFQWYYLGIRSGHITVSAARSIWEWLEATEWERLSSEKDLTLGSKVPELKHGYEKVGFFCKTPSAVTASESGQDEPVSRVEFQPFFKNIQNGQISCEQLKLAVYLRSLPPAELKESPELSDLKQKIWNELKI